MSAYGKSTADENDTVLAASSSITTPPIFASHDTVTRAEADVALGELQ